MVEFEQIDLIMISYKVNVKYTDKLKYCFQSKYVYVYKYKTEWGRRYSESDFGYCIIGNGI